jgi:hypothetical protein
LVGMGGLDSGLRDLVEETVSRVTVRYWVGEV